MAGALERNRTVLSIQKRVEKREEGENLCTKYVGRCTENNCIGTRNKPKWDRRNFLRREEERRPLAAKGEGESQSDHLTSALSPIGAEAESVT
jgi:hypothetical protein